MSSIMINCCDPFNRHKTKKTNVSDASEETINHGKRLKIDVAGKKICKQCKSDLKKRADGTIAAQATAIEEESEGSRSSLEMDVDPMEPSGSGHSLQKTPSKQHLQTMEHDVDPTEPSGSGYTLRITPSKQHLQPMEHELEAIIGPHSPSPPDRSDIVYDDERIQKNLNALLVSLGHEEMNNSSLTSGYLETIVDTISVGLSASLFKNAITSNTSTDKCKDCAEILSQLKDKFQNSTDRVKKYQILSVVPKSWSANKVATTFDTTWYMANNAIKMVKQHGILFPVAKKVGSNTIPSEVVNLVKDFYRSDEVSSDRPAMSDKTVVWENGVKIEKQIKLILMNLKEAHALFKEKYPNVKIGFSKFASVRPKECKTALDKRGMLAVCVCIYHQNTKLAADALLRNMSVSPDIKDYKDFCAKLMCATQTVECHMRTCKNCKSETDLRKILNDAFTDGYERIIYKQWMTTEDEKRQSTY